MAPDLSRRRPHRRNFNDPGHAHELTFSCYRRYPFFTKDRVCDWLGQSIEHARVQLQLDLWAWVFMPDHIHVIIRPRKPIYDIAVILRQIKEPVARQAIRWIRQHAPEWLPKLQRQRGKRLETLFWQSGGGYDRNITDSSTLLNMVDDVPLNPVRKGLVERAIDWKWSSAAWWSETGPTPIIPDRIPPDWLAHS